MPRPSPRKSLGQHFLEPPWADKLVAALEPGPADTFVEIGPGPGALTLRLAPLVAQLTAIELDPRMVAELAPRVPGNVRLVQADVLEADLAALVPEGRFRVAGNLPYNVSSPILFRLIDLHLVSGRVSDATLMLQREVADRLTARPGTKDYGVLTILAGLHADIARVLALPPGAFRPAPRVHSAVVRLRFRPPAVALADQAIFTAMVRSMFTQRRKALSNALAPFAAGRGRDAAAALAAAGIDPRRRGETLQLTELARLADHFASA